MEMEMEMKMETNGKKIIISGKAKPLSLSLSRAHHG